MSIYDPSPLYDLAVKAEKEYCRFFTAIAVAKEAEQQRSKDLTQSLHDLQKSCSSFLEVIRLIQSTCNNDILKQRS